MGHMLNQTEMDILTRWRRMRGDRALWLPGTDHAGIATQMMVERQLANEGTTRQKLGREAFVERVWEWKRHYGGAILDQMKRLGASVDWQREYFTMDERLSVAVREAFVRLHEQGLIYRGAYIVNWCPRCQTAISDLEVVYDEHKGHLWEIRYPVVGDDGKDTGEFLTVATTRPETMLGDMAVAIHPEDERYLHLHGKKLRLPLMNREIPVILGRVGQPRVRYRRGEGDTGARSQRLRDRRAAQSALDQRDGRDGPHQCRRRARMRDSIAMSRARRSCTIWKSRACWPAVKDHTNNVGHCDRCKTVVEPRLSTQWFVKIQPLADKAIAAVEAGPNGKSNPLYAGAVREDLPRVDGEHSRLVHLAAVVVGTSHSRVALRDMPQDHRGARRSDRLRALRLGQDHAGNRRARHVVLLGAAAGFGVWLAEYHGGDIARILTRSIPPACW